jgi:two-component system, sensor histidine kinase PdtaS
MKFIFLPAAFLLLLQICTAQDKNNLKDKPLNPGELPSAIVKMIDSAINTGKLDTAAADKVFKEAIAKSKKINNDYLAGKAFYEMGEMYFHHKNHNRSFGSFFNARDYFHKAGAEKEEAYTLFGLGRQQYLRGNYKVAAGHLNYAIRGAKKFKLPALESDALGYLGILYHVMPGTVYQGTDYLKRSLVIKERLNDNNGMLRMMEKLADVYYRQKKFDSALLYLNLSIKKATGLKLFHDADLSRLNRVGTYIRLNNMKEAEKELADVIATTTDTADQNVMIRYYIQQGNYHTADEAFEKGKQHYDKAIEVANRIGVPDMYGMVYENMAEAYSYKGMYKEAYDFLQQYNLQMAGFYAENLTVIKELELILNTSLTKDEVAYLTAENKLKEIRFQSDTKIKRLLLYGVIIFVLLSAAIFYLYNRQKIKNSIIKKQAKELQAMMKETDHRVKNNLQIISGILDLQSTSIKDAGAALMIKECRNKVQGMALIHQELYSEKNNSGIAIDVYVDNLAKSIFNTYNIHTEKVKLVTDIEKIKLDVDTVISIGLILNELISNCLKHAFTKIENGILLITLKRKDGVLFLQVKDNGQGFNDIDSSLTNASFGIKMVKAFAKKLNAGIEINNNAGACVNILIEKYRIVF